AIFQKGFANRLPGRPESNRVHEFAVAGSKTRTNVIVPDRVGVDQRMGRQRQHGLRIAGTVRSRPRQKICKCEREPARGNGAIDQQRAVASRRLDRSRKSVFEKGAEGAERSFLESNPGSHGMAAALVEQSFLYGMADRAAEIDPGDRPPRPCPG